MWQFGVTSAAAASAALHVTIRRSAASARLREGQTQAMAVLWHLGLRYRLVLPLKYCVRGRRWSDGADCEHRNSAGPTPVQPQACRDARLRIASAGRIRHMRAALTRAVPPARAQRPW